MVNTELPRIKHLINIYYNILNIVVNTELRWRIWSPKWNYNILNIVVNTEHKIKGNAKFKHYNILNIVVNTEP